MIKHPYLTEEGKQAVASGMVVNGRLEGRPGIRIMSVGESGASVEVGLYEAMTNTQLAVIDYFDIPLGDCLVITDAPASLPVAFVN